MINMLFGRASATAVMCLAVATTAIARPGAPRAAGVAKPTGENSFHGRVTSATGRLAGNHGRVRIGFFPVASDTTTRSLLITLKPRPCREAKDCVRLRGTLHGSITRVPSIPDTGSAFKITAHGTVHPLGGVMMSGTARGVGNARFGRGTVRLTVTGNGGAVTVAGTSGRVPGFSSP